MDGGIGEFRLQRAVGTYGQMQFVTAFDQPARQINHVLLAAADAVCRANLQNLHARNYA